MIHKKRLLTIFNGLFFLLIAMSTHALGQSPHIVLITVDDMSADSVGVYGSMIANTTPNIDTLAKESIRFDFAHVTSASCTPSRNAMQSGLYPYVSGADQLDVGVINTYETLPDVMKAAGYYTMIRGKVLHTSPHAPYPAWDYRDGSDSRVPQTFYDSTIQAYGNAAAAGKPLMLTINIKDPHTGFFGYQHKQDIVDSTVYRKVGDDWVVQPTAYTQNASPGKVYDPDDIDVNEFLAQLPNLSDKEWGETNVEIASYLNNVGRSDESVKKILDAIKEAGEENNTVVFFLSDHGMPFPFVKTNLYHHSTRTPLMVRWPGVTTPNSRDTTHMISTIDILPTLCDIIGVPHPVGMNGRSFEPLLRGQTQSGRDYVLKSHGSRPMRAIQSRDYLYIFNPFAYEGSGLSFNSVTTNTETYRSLNAVRDMYPQVDERLDFFKKRTEEELYDIANDPHCLNNLIGDPSYQTRLNTLRTELENQMAAMGDPALDAFRNRTVASLVGTWAKDKVNADKMKTEDPFQKPTPPFTPLDDWLTLSYDNFDNGFQYWQAGNSGALVDTDPANAAFNLSQSLSLIDAGAMISSTEYLSADQMAGLKISFHAMGSNLESGDGLHVNYTDGSTWQTADTFFLTDSHAPYELELFPSGAFEPDLEFALLANTDDPDDQININTLRIAGWIDWRPLCDDDFTNGFGNWSPGGANATPDSRGIALRGNKGAASSMHLSDTLDGTQLVQVRLTFTFTPVKIDANEGIVVEYHNGSQWISVKEYLKGYVENGITYRDVVTLDTKVHTFTSSLNIRIRSDAGGNEEGADIHGAMVETRGGVEGGGSGGGNQVPDNGSGDGNQTPAANAGPDQVLTDTDGLPGEVVSLDSTGSRDGDGSIATYVWNEGNHTIATGPAPSVTLENGVHTITLTVTDNDGGTASDTVVIEVAAPPEVPPQGGQVELFHDDFETATTGGGGQPDPNKGWVCSGNIWLGATDGTSGSNGLRIRHGNSVISKAIDTTGLADITVSFDVRTEGYEAGENGRFRWSSDNGATWTVAAVYDSTVSDYVNQSIILPASAADNPLFVFGFTSHGNENTERLYLDNIGVKGTIVSESGDSDGSSDNNSGSDVTDGTDGDSDSNSGADVSDGTDGDSGSNSGADVTDGTDGDSGSNSGADVSDGTGDTNVSDDANLADGAGQTGNPDATTAAEGTGGCFIDSLTSVNQLIENK